MARGKKNNNGKKKGMGYLKIFNNRDNYYQILQNIRVCFFSFKIRIDRLFE